MEDSWGGYGERTSDGRREGVTDDGGVGINGFGEVGGEGSRGVAVVTGVITEAVIAG